MDSTIGRATAHTWLQPAMRSSTATAPESQQAVGKPVAPAGGRVTDCLTRDDWALLSSVAGEPVGPGTKNYSDDPHMMVGPLIIADLVAARSSGVLSGGQPAPAAFFEKLLELGRQPQPVLDQYQRALDYIQRRDAQTPSAAARYSVDVRV